MKYIIPAFISLILIFSLKKKEHAYELFCDGAGEGMKIAAGIFPALLAILTAAAMLRASGAIEMLCNFIMPITDKLGIPSEVVPLILLRPVSGSGSLGMLSDILNRFGADSIEGTLASVICASTETTFYCIMVYYSATRTKSTLKAVPCAIIGDIAGILGAVLAVRFLI